MSTLPPEPHVTKSFALSEMANRRFMFDPRKKVFLLGDVRKALTIASSHAHEFYELTGSNAGFDRMLRGWIGMSRTYPHGVIHFSPKILSAEEGGSLRIQDQALDMLSIMLGCGATAKTLVRGFPPEWEQPLGNLIEGAPAPQKKASPVPAAAPRP